MIRYDLPRWLNKSSSSSSSTGSSGRLEMKGYLMFHVQLTYLFVKSEHNHNSKLKFPYVFRIMFNFIVMLFKYNSLCIRWIFIIIVIHFLWLIQITGHYFCYIFTFCATWRVPCAFEGHLCVKYEHNHNTKLEFRDFVYMMFKAEKSWSYNSWDTFNYV